MNRPPISVICKDPSHDRPFLVGRFNWVELERGDVPVQVSETVTMWPWKPVRQWVLVDTSSGVRKLGPGLRPRTGHVSDKRAEVSHMEGNTVVLVCPRAHSHRRARPSAEWCNRLCESLTERGKESVILKDIVTTLSS